MTSTPSKSPQFEAFDRLCPMHVFIDKMGVIINAGPSFQKLWPDSVLGTSFLDLLKPKKQGNTQDLDWLFAQAGRKLSFVVQTDHPIGLKGLLMPFDLGQETDMQVAQRQGALINLSFGISVLEAVQHYDLTSSDFAPTDLTIEMLYLLEANSAAMSASRTLNERLQGAKLAAEEQAYTDTLTGLKNRRAMDFLLPRLVEHRTDFALLNLDLDFFKAVNDTMGHAAGDHVLQEVARVMKEETREEDIIVRTGGDEFVLIFVKMNQRAKLSEIADRLIKKIEVPIPFNGQDCNVSASIGATLSCWYDTPDLDVISDDADVALYAAKDNGRGCHVVYDAKLREIEVDAAKRLAHR